MTHSKIHIIGISEKVEKRYNSKAIFEDKMIDHFPEVIKPTGLKSAVNL